MPYFVEYYAEMKKYVSSIRVGETLSSTIQTMFRVQVVYQNFVQFDSAILLSSILLFHELWNPPSKWQSLLQSMMDATKADMSPSMSPDRFHNVHLCYIWFIFKWFECSKVSVYRSILGFRDQRHTQRAQKWIPPSRIGIHRDSDSNRCLAWAIFHLEFQYYHRFPTRRDMRSIPSQKKASAIKRPSAGSFKEMRNALSSSIVVGTLMLPSIKRGKEDPNPVIPEKQ